MKYLSLFSGYGGFELGIQQAYEAKSNRILGNRELSTKETDIRQELPMPNSSSELGNGWGELPKCIGFSEIDKYAIQVYKKHFNHKEYGDITKLNPSKLPDFDLLCGGFPCQAFSIAGKRAGFEDTRGTLIYDVFRIIKEKHPKLVLLENVKGLLSHDNGRTFKTIITSLAELGYAVEWQVLNAKNFGVPQNRERVFIIGHLGGFGGRQVFPIGENAGLLGKADKSKKTQSQTKFASTIRTKEGTRSDDNFIVSERTGNVSVEPCIVSRPHGFNTGGEKEMPCLRSCNNFSGNELLKNDFKIRRLTPTECERLMGLPDGWTEGVSDTQRYKLCGNGVVVNVVKEIIKQLTL